MYQKGSWLSSPWWIGAGSVLSPFFFGHFLCQSLTPLPSLPSCFSKKRIVDSFSTVIESSTQFCNMGGACLTDDTLCCSAACSQCITLRFGKGDDKLKRLWIGDFPYKLLLSETKMSRSHPVQLRSPAKAPREGWGDGSASLLCKLWT